MQPLVSLKYIYPENPVKEISTIAGISTGTSKETFSEQSELVRKVVKLKHFSCLEFGGACFEIVCSRCCANQATRHRHFSYMQESQRRVKFPELNKSSGNFKDDMKYLNVYAKENFIFPPSIIENEDSEFDCCLSLINEVRYYQNLISQGIRKEDARYLLPNACKTKLIMCGNFRSWREFLKKRLHKTAQWEIRDIAGQILDILIEKVPYCFEDMRELYDKLYTDNLKKDTEDWEDFQKTNKDLLDFAKEHEEKSGIHKMLGID